MLRIVKISYFRTYKHLIIFVIKKHSYFVKAFILKLNLIIYLMHSPFFVQFNWIIKLTSKIICKILNVVKIWKLNDFMRDECL